MSINNLYLDFKNLMYTLQIDEHIETLWDFLEENELLDGVNDDVVEEAYEEGYQDGSNDKADEMLAEATNDYERGYVDGMNAK